MGKFFYIDDRPIEELTLKEREERFLRQIGTDYYNCSESDKQLLLKAYLLEEYPEKRRIYKMTKEQVAYFEKVLSEYEPYSDEEINAIELDGEYDHNRMEATKAKLFLEDFILVDTLKTTDN